MKTAEDDDIFGPENPEETEIERAKLNYAIALEILRRARKLSYKDVANQYGKSAGYISRIFRGDENVTIATMVKLARVLKGKVSVFVSDATSPHVAAQNATLTLTWPYIDRRRRDIVQISDTFGRFSAQPLTEGNKFWGQIRSLKSGRSDAIYLVPITDLVKTGTENRDVSRKEN